jgi:hypothetical protein
MSLNQAKSALADALDAERAASEAEATAAKLIQQEVAAASESTADDLAVEALAAWLPKAQACLAATVERHRLASASTGRARAELGAARAAAAAVDRIIEVTQAEERAATQKQTHAEMTERSSDRRGGTDTEIPPSSAAGT